MYSIYLPIVGRVHVFNSICTDISHYLKTRGKRLNTISSSRIQRLEAEGSNSNLCRSLGSKNVSTVFLVHTYGTRDIENRYHLRRQQQDLRPE